MLKQKPQYFGHLMRRTDSLEKTLMMGKVEGGRRRGRQRMRWLGDTTDSMDMSLNKFPNSINLSAFFCNMRIIFWGCIQSIQLMLFNTPVGEDT